MAISYDICLQRNDLYINDGDFVIAESDEQHIVDTLSAFPGWWKENAPDGVGLFQYLKSAGKEQEITREIKIQLQSDGYQVNVPTVKTDSSGQMIVNPNAVRN